jgi:hypothetical protein
VINLIPKYINVKCGTMSSETRDKFEELLKLPIRTSDADSLWVVDSNDKKFFVSLEEFERVLVVNAAFLEEIKNLRNDIISFARNLMSNLLRR